MFIHHVPRGLPFSAQRVPTGTFPFRCAPLAPIWKERQKANKAKCHCACVDVVSVCTPDATHFDIIKNIFESDSTPKVIFVEKPVCSNHEELNYLEYFSRQKKTQIIVNHTRRFEEKHQDLKKLITLGTLGRLVRGDIFYYGGWKHNGVHIVDIIGVLVKKVFQRAILCIFLN